VTKMKRIGITGGIGSGKTEVTNIIREEGYIVIDADEISRELAKPGGPVLERLNNEIGQHVFSEDGHLDRKALAALMFNDPETLETVNRIFHPEIKRRISDLISIAASENRKAVFISAPLLFESGADKETDEVWLVTADDDIRIKRTAERDGISEKEVSERIRNQMPETEKLKKADVIIENNGSLEQLRSEIKTLLYKL